MPFELPSIICYSQKFINRRALESTLKALRLTSLPATAITFGLMGVAFAPVAWAECSEVAETAYECTGSFANQTILLGPTDLVPLIPDSATSITIQDLTSDIGPASSGSPPGGGVVALLYEGTASAETIDLSISFSDFAIIANAEAEGVTIDSEPGAAAAGSLAGDAGRSVTFTSDIDIDAQLAAGETTSAFEMSTDGGTGGTPETIGGNNAPGGAGGAGGDVTVTGSGTYGNSVSGSAGDLVLGVGIVSQGGDGGTGGKSNNNNGGDGGTGGAGGDVSLSADGTWTIDVSGDLTSGTQGGVVVITRGGEGGDGGDGGNNKGVAGQGGAGGTIKFDDDGDDVWSITAAGVPGMFLTSEGGPAGDVGHSTPGSSGDGGAIHKETSSTMSITTQGDKAVAFQALSRGGQGTETTVISETLAPAAKSILAELVGFDHRRYGAWTGCLQPGGSPASGGKSASAGMAARSKSLRTEASRPWVIRRSGSWRNRSAAMTGQGAPRPVPTSSSACPTTPATAPAAWSPLRTTRPSRPTDRKRPGSACSRSAAGGGAHGSDFEDFFSGSSETTGGAGGAIDVSNSAVITTLGAGSDGILAQSLGGAGGTGSSSTSGSGLGSKPSKTVRTAAPFR